MEYFARTREGEGPEEWQGLEERSLKGEGPVGIHVSGR